MKNTFIAIEKIADAIAFTKLCSQQPFHTDLKSGRHIVDAKSQLGVFTLDLEKPCELVITAAEDGSQDTAVETFLAAVNKWVVPNPETK